MFHTSNENHTGRATIMTNEQFDALATLLRMGARGASAQAARLVLVDGLDKRSAATQCDITLDALYKCLARCEHGRILARIAAGIISERE